MVFTGTGRIRIVPGMLMIGVLMRSMVNGIPRVSALTVRTRRRAQHGSRDRNPNREQDGKQHKQPDTKGSHGGVRLARHQKRHGPWKAALMVGGVPL